MASTFEPTHASSALGKWVEDLYSRILGQPDDEVAASALKEGVAEGFTARINHDQFTRQAFIDYLMKFRVSNTSSIKSTRDIKSWDAPDGSGAGCVSQLVHVTDTNKDTGVVSKASTLLVANVQVIGGQKQLLELTEVFHASE